MQQVQKIAQYLFAPFKKFVLFGGFEYQPQQQDEQVQFSKSKNPISRLLFSWASPLLLKGLNEDISTRHISKEFPDFIPVQETSQQLFDKYKQQQEDTKWPLLRAMISLFGWTMLMVVFPRILLELFTNVSFYLFGAVITQAEVASGNADVATWSSWSWKHTTLLFMLLFVVAKCVQTLLEVWALYFADILQDRIKGALCGMLHMKAVRINSEARQEYSTGEIVNLMSTDVNRIRGCVHSISFGVSGFSRLTFSIILMFMSLGYSTFFGLAIIVCLVPVNFLIQRRIEKHITNYDNLADARLKIVQEMCNSIRVLKMFVWESIFKQRVSKIRDDEVAELKATKLLSCIVALFWGCIPFFVSAACFAGYALVMKQTITPSIAFAVLNIILGLSWPLNVIPESIVELGNGKISILRLQKFLSAPEVDVQARDNEDALDIDFSMHAAEWSWHRTRDSTLKDISTKIKSGELVVVIGKVGSGKSSLCSALIGEMHKMAGSSTFKSSKSISYVPQSAWIRNATVRDNILFGQSFDEARYNQVLHACALHSDMAQWPAQDMTELGERGINISGGQKARVNLARALYANSDIIIMDDTLSALDVGVGKHVLNEVVFGLAKDKTRIMVTHHIHFVEHADKIIIMKDGTIESQGSYAELMQSSAYFNNLITEYANPVESAMKPIQLNETPVSKLEQVDAKADSKLIDEEKKASGRVKFQVLRKYLTKYSLPMFLLLLFLAALIQAKSLSYDGWLVLWSRDESSVNNIVFYVVGYVILGCIGAVIDFLFFFVGMLYGLKTSQVYHENMLDSVLHAPLQFFESTPCGRVVTRFGTDMYQMDYEMGFQIRETFETGIYIIVCVITVVALSPMYLLFIVPLAVLLYLIQYYYRKTTVELDRFESVTTGPIYSHFAETIDGLASIRSYNKQKLIFDEQMDKLLNHLKVNYAKNVSNRWLTVRLDFTSWFSVCVPCALFVVFLPNTPSIQDASFLGVLMLRALGMAYGFNWFVVVSSWLETNLSKVERVQQFCELTPEKYIGNSKVELDASWPAEGSITITDAVLRYRENDKPVLHGVNVNINAKEKVGIVGKTGSGKTTLLSALFRLRELESGAICIDGSNVADMNLNDVRSAIAVIPQDPILLTGSLRESLDQSGAFTDVQIWKALEQVYLKEKVSKMEGQLNAEITEGALTFSNGERQLLCLARALLRNKKILVLDEATANVDLETDALIQKTIRSEFKNCTVLCIAHRLETIMDYDKILVLNKGNVEEYDTPSNLILKKSTFFNMIQHTEVKGTQAQAA